MNLKNKRKYDVCTHLTYAHTLIPALSMVGTEENLQLLDTNLRAHNRRYEAVLETAPRTNSIVCIS